MPTCNDCDFTSTDPTDWEGSWSAYHDVKCPNCGTTDVDTSDWLAQDEEYGYGDNNSLVTDAA